MEEGKRLLTQSGYEKLQTELEDLKVNARKEIAEKIKEARAQGDLSENAEYDAALDELEKLVTKRKQLEDKKLLEAYHAGGKTADEIIEFIRSGVQKKE